MARLKIVTWLLMALWMTTVSGAWAADKSVTDGARDESLQLVMFEQKACEWCAVWKEQIGPIYPKTPEGKRAPLRRVDIHDPHPADLADIRTSRFTPTFVLVNDGQEIGRINGYPGEDFFWGLLGQMLKKHDKRKQKGQVQ